MVASRLSNFHIRVGKTFDWGLFDPETYAECWYQDSAPDASETRQFSCSAPVTGRYLTVHFPKNKTEYLTVCEVQVFSESGNCVEIVLL